MVPQAYGENLERSSDEGDYDRTVYDDDEISNDDEINASDWEKSQTNSGSTESNCSLQESVQDEVHMSTEPTGLESDLPRSIPMVSESDIDRFLDFQRARCDKKRKHSVESDEFKAKKQNLSMESTVESEQNRSIESDSNLSDRRIERTVCEKYKPNSKIQQSQLSNYAATKLRSQTASLLEAETTSRNRIRTFCYFCEKELAMNFREWSQHLLAHTGEEEFYCTGCNTGLPKYKPQHCTQSKNLKNISGNVTAALCNICDYVQINAKRVINHIMVEHMKSEEKAEDSLVNVLLIPDLRPVPKLHHTKYKYVRAKYLHKCGVKDCNINCNAADQFKAHFIHKHSDARSILCPHCKNQITNIEKDVNLFVDVIFKHLKHHASIKNQCNSCDLTFCNDRKIIQHILNEHDIDKIHFSREIRASSQLQEAIILFECNLCKARINNDHQAIQHYLKCHNSHHADFKLIQLVKEMNVDNVIKYTMFDLDEKLMFQQHFVCSWCNDILITKTQLILHHHTKHRRNHELNIKFTTKFLTKSEYNFNLYHQNSSFDQYLMYSCGICSDSLFYNDATEVYNHWHDTHTKQSFRFMVEPLAQCHYCKCISTFEGLKIHHTEKHSMVPFAIRNLIDRSKCGLCLSNRNGAFVSHFENDHSKLLKAKLRNPIALDNDTVENLLKVKGRKKRKCQHCAEIFESKSDFKYHHARKHPLADASTEKFYDYEVNHLITGCCAETIKPAELFDHLNAHDLSSKSQLKEYYWKTKIVFGNGLVLNKYNLRGTKHDDSKNLRELFKSMKTEK